MAFFFDKISHIRSKKIEALARNMILWRFAFNLNYCFLSFNNMLQIKQKYLNILPSPIYSFEYICNLTSFNQIKALTFSLSAKQPVRGADCLILLIHTRDIYEAHVNSMDFRQ